jgi:hypothetical protein
MHTKFQLEKMNRRDYKGTKFIWEDNIKINVIKIQDVRVWTGFIWLRIGPSDRQL